MTSVRRPETTVRWTENPVVRVALYYVLLFAGSALLIQLVPGAEALFTGLGATALVAQVEAQRSRPALSPA